MALVIEAGSGDNAAANSYATAAQLTDYADARGVTLTGDPEQLLLRAMDYSETLSFSGTKASRDQPLQWPRRGVWIDGYSVPSDAIPNELKRAQMVTAIAISDGRDPLAAIDPAIKREKVDVLEVEYQDGAASASVSVDIMRTWSKLTGGSIGGNQIPVRRL